MDPGLGDLTVGDVLVEGRHITAVGADLGETGADDVLDASGCLVIPGFVDTHRHMWEGGLRGCVPSDTLEGYFRRVVLGIGPRLTPEDLAIGEALSAAASLAAGITTVQDTSDIHDSPQRTDAIVGALKESGLRVVFAYGLSRPYLNEHGSAMPHDVRRVRTELLSDDDALVTMALSIPPGEDDAERHNAALARELGVRAARHTRIEIPPSRLADLDALVPGTTFVHGNGLDQGELQVIVDAGGSLSIAPVVELALGLGAPMVAEALAVPGLPITLSVDVEVTGPTDMFSQMRAAYLAVRPGAGRPTPREVLHWATLGGAQSLGLGERTGSVTPGKEADLLVLRADRADVAPVTDPYSTVVLQMDRAHIDTVLVAGAEHKRGGQPVRDDQALRAQALTTLGRLGPAS